MLNNYNFFTKYTILKNTVSIYIKILNYYNKHNAKALTKSCNTFNSLMLLISRNASKTLNVLPTASNFNIVINNIINNIVETAYLL